MCKQKKTAQDMKEFNKDMENIRKKKRTEILEIKNYLNQIKNTVESHYNKGKTESQGLMTKWILK
jgi:seryl-tRNA synthetase